MSSIDKHKTKGKNRNEIDYLVAALKKNMESSHSGIKSSTSSKSSHRSALKSDTMLDKKAGQMVKGTKMNPATRTDSPATVGGNSVHLWNQKPITGKKRKAEQITPTPKSKKSKYEILLHAEPPSPASGDEWDSDFEHNAESNAAKSTDIDDIFDQIAQRKKAKYKLSSKQAEEDAALQVLLKRAQEKSQNKSASQNTKRDANRRYTEDGFPIYTVEELGLNDNGGDTPLCPFDCQCCF